MANYSIYVDVQFLRRKMGGPVTITLGYSQKVVMCLVIIWLGGVSYICIAAW